MDKLDALTETRVMKAVEVVSQLSEVAGAYLFGSHVEGTPDEFSDIDIAVFVEGAEGFDMIRIARTTARVQKEAGDDIEVHFFPAGALASPEPASFSDYIIRHGKRIA